MENIFEISVVLCVYNMQSYVQNAIQSILAQEGVGFEFIIVDDASTDNSLSIITELTKNISHVRVVPLPHNQGLAGALNTVIPHIRSPLTALMDADDVALPGRLAAQRGFMAANPDVDVLGGSMLLMTSDGSPYTPDMHICRIGPETLGWLLMFENTMCNPTMMIRTNFLKRFPYSNDPVFRYCVDYELWSRMNVVARFDNLQLPLVRYRRHDKQGSVTYLENQNQAALECARWSLSTLLEEDISSIDALILRESRHHIIPLEPGVYARYTELLSRLFCKYIQRVEHIRQIKLLGPVGNQLNATIQDLSIRISNLVQGAGLSPEQTLNEIRTQLGKLSSLIATSNPPAS
ncbi:glycosyltransferase family 2 protein [Acetobacter sp.]|uniref:glycosyltransferase family 2 protein n=1 Tax=Acetobacter sp. TaxID=440 RepID=UPI0039E79E7B